MKLKLFLEPLMCGRVCYIGWKRVPDIDNSSIEVLFRESQATERFCEGVGCVRRTCM